MNPRHCCGELETLKYHCGPSRFTISSPSSSLSRTGVVPSNAHLFPLLMRGVWDRVAFAVRDCTTAVSLANSTAVSLGTEQGLPNDTGATCLAAKWSTMRAWLRIKLSLCCKMPHTCLSSIFLVSSAACRCDWVTRAVVKSSSC